MPSCASSTPMLNPASSGSSALPAASISLSAFANPKPCTKPKPKASGSRSLDRRGSRLSRAGHGDRRGDGDFDGLSGQLHGARDRQRQRGRMRDGERGDDGHHVARHLPKARGALPLAVDRPHHRRQQQQQHERDVVVADEHVPDAFADEAREAAPRPRPARARSTTGSAALSTPVSCSSPRTALNSTRCEASPLMNSAPPTAQQARVADSRPAAPRTGSSVRCALASAKSLHVQRAGRAAALQ